MDCLQALVNNLLVWQSSCKSKLHPLNSKSISPAVWQCSACNWNINKQLVRKLVWLILFPDCYFLFLFGDGEKRVWWISVCCFVLLTPRFWESLIGVNNYKGHPLNEVPLICCVHVRLLRTQQRNFAKRMAFIVVNTY